MDRYLEAEADVLKDMDTTKLYKSHGLSNSDLKVLRQIKSNYRRVKK